MWSTDFQVGMGIQKWIQNPYPVYRFLYIDNDCLHVWLMILLIGSASAQIHDDVTCLFSQLTWHLCRSVSIFQYLYNTSIGPHKLQVMFCIWYVTFQ